MNENDSTTNTEVADIEALLTPTETKFVPLSVLTEVQERLQTRLEDMAREKSLVFSKFQNFRTDVRDRFALLVQDESLDRERANDSLEALGLEKLVRKWTVRGSYNSDEVIVVSGIEAEESEYAIEEVREHLTATAQPESIVYSVEYDGDGVEENTFDYTEEYPDDDSDAADDFLDGLEFTAEEE